MRLPVHLADELRAVARENERSLSAEARMALREWLTRSGEPNDGDGTPGPLGNVVDPVQAAAPGSSPHTNKEGGPATPQSPRPAPRQETS